MRESRGEPLVRIASQWLLGVLLAIALTAFFLSLNAVQLTAPGTGQRIHRQAIVVITDIDAILPDVQEELVTAAAAAEGDTVTVPDFPIAVEVPTDEAAALSGEELRERILAAAARRVYEEGMSAFAAADPEARQDIELFSTEGAIRRGLDFITDDAHAALRIVVAVLGFISAALALALLASVRSYMRLLALGAVTLVAALPSLATAVAIRFGLRAAEEEQANAFVSGLLKLGVDATWLPIRNYIALSALGLALLALGLLLIWLQGRLAAAPPPPSIDKAIG